MADAQRLHARSRGSLRKRASRASLSKAGSTKAATSTLGRASGRAVLAPLTPNIPPSGRMSPYSKASDAPKSVVPAKTPPASKTKQSYFSRLKNLARAPGFAAVRRGVKAALGDTATTTDAPATPTSLPSVLRAPTAISNNPGPVFVSSTATSAPAIPKAAPTTAITTAVASTSPSPPALAPVTISAPRGVISLGATAFVPATPQSIATSSRISTRAASRVPTPRSTPKSVPSLSTSPTHTATASTYPSSIPPTPSRTTTHHVDVLAHIPTTSPSQSFSVKSHPKSEAPKNVAITVPSTSQVCEAVDMPAPVGSELDLTMANSVTDTELSPAPDHGEEHAIKIAVSIGLAVTEIAEETAEVDTPFSTITDTAATPSSAATPTIVPTPIVAPTLVSTMISATPIAATPAIATAQTPCTPTPRAQTPVTAATTQPRERSANSTPATTPSLTPTALRAPRPIEQLDTAVCDAVAALSSLARLRLQTALPTTQVEWVRGVLAAAGIGATITLSKQPGAVPLRIAGAEETLWVVVDRTTPQVPATPPTKSVTATPKPPSILFTPQTQSVPTTPGTAADSPQWKVLREFANLPAADRQILQGLSLNTWAKKQSLLAHAEPSRTADPTVAAAVALARLPPNIAPTTPALEVPLLALQALSVSEAATVNASDKTSAAWYKEIKRLYQLHLLRDTNTSATENAPVPRLAEQIEPPLLEQDATTADEDDSPFVVTRSSTLVGPSPPTPPKPSSPRRNRPHKFARIRSHYGDYSDSAMAGMGIMPMCECPTPEGMVRDVSISYETFNPHLKLTPNGGLETQEEGSSRAATPTPAARPTKPSPVAKDVKPFEVVKTPTNDAKRDEYPADKTANNTAPATPHPASAQAQSREELSAFFSQLQAVGAKKRRRVPGSPTKPPLPAPWVIDESEMAMKQLMSMALVARPAQLPSDGLASIDAYRAAVAHTEARQLARQNLNTNVFVIEAEKKYASVVLEATRARGVHHWEHVAPLANPDHACEAYRDLSRAFPTWVKGKPRDQWLVPPGTTGPLVFNECEVCEDLRAAQASRDKLAEAAYRAPLAEALVIQIEVDSFNDKIAHLKKACPPHVCKLVDHSKGKAAPENLFDWIVFYGLSTGYPTVPCLFWSNERAFAFAALKLVQLRLGAASDVGESVNDLLGWVFVKTHRLRKGLRARGAFVGWVAMDFGLDPAVMPLLTRFMTFYFPDTEAYNATYKLLGPDATFWYDRIDRAVVIFDHTYDPDSTRHHVYLDRDPVFVESNPFLTNSEERVGGMQQGGAQYALSSIVGPMWRAFPANDGSVNVAPFPSAFYGTSMPVVSTRLSEPERSADLYEFMEEVARWA